MLGYPDKGFQNENKISRYEALWNDPLGSKANFEEDYKGSIEVGKQADFVILDRDIMQIFEKKSPKQELLLLLLTVKLSIPILLSKFKFRI